MTEHLGYAKNSSAVDNSGNSRNGHTKKTGKNKKGNQKPLVIYWINIVCNIILVLAAVVSLVYLIVNK